MNHALTWPVKTRELHNHTMDSTRWDHFRYREGDIVIASWAKTGTTWLQQILGQLIFAGAEGLPIVDMCGWIELRFLPLQDVLNKVEAQTHRRFVKTHLPADALNISPLGRYLYIGRDGRDALWSWHNHHLRMTDSVYQILNGTPGLVGPPLKPACEDPRQFFHEWLDGDGFPIWPFFSNVQSWWNIRSLPNVMLLHFNDLKRDMPGQIRRIARFLDIELPDDVWPRVFEHCTFDYMRANGSSLSNILWRGFTDGSNDFIYRGTNGRWRDVLTSEDLRKYDAFVAKNLSPDCARWLASGSLAE